MANKDDALNAMSRRNFLKTSTMAGMGLGLGGAGMFGPALAQAATTISFAGWAFEPQVVEASVKRFMAENPDIKVNYTPLDLQLYAEKMVALFNAGTQTDCVLRARHAPRRLGRGGLAAADRRPAQTRRTEQGHLPGDAADAALQGQAVRRAVLRRHLRLHVRQGAA